jgi:hypothetical protein
MLIYMHSKLRINSSNKVSRSLGLKIRHNRIMAKETLTHRMKDRERKANLKRASPRCKHRKVTRSLRKKLESGVSSIKSPGTTSMNVARNNYWWSSSKKNNQNLTWTLIQRIIKGNMSLMSNPLLPSRPQQYNQKNQRSLRMMSASSTHRCG